MAITSGIKDPKVWLYISKELVVNSKLICSNIKKEIQKKSKSKLDGHTVLSVCLSPHGATLAFGNWIRLRDIKTGQEISKLDDNND